MTDSAEPDSCSFCRGKITFATYIPPADLRSPGHRVYRCEACGRIETIWEPPREKDA